MCNVARLTGAIGLKESDMRKVYMEEHCLDQSVVAENFGDVEASDEWLERAIMCSLAPPVLYGWRWEDSDD